MTIEELKKLKRDTEKKIAELLDDFTEKTGFYIFEVHTCYENMDYLRTLEDDYEPTFSDINVKFDIKL